MRIPGLPATALALLALLPPPPASAEVSVRFLLGAGIVGTGDLAGGIGGYNDLASALYGPGLRGKFSAPGPGFEPAAEVVFRLGPRLGIGFGAGYGRFSNSSEMSYSAAAAAVTESLTARISAVPIQLNLHLFIPLSARIVLDAWAGPGVALTRLGWETGMVFVADGLKSEDRFAFRADKTVFGGQAGLGVHFRISSALDLSAEAFGRIAASSGFKGPWTETARGDLWSLIDKGEATVWAFDRSYGSKPYRQISFQESRPSGTGVSGAEEAKIGLSGIGLRVGLGIRFPFAGRKARR